MSMMEEDEAGEDVREMVRDFMSVLDCVTFDDNITVKSANRAWKWALLMEKIGQGAMMDAKSSTYVDSVLLSLQDGPSTPHNMTLLTTASLLKARCLVAAALLANQRLSLETLSHVIGLCLAGLNDEANTDRPSHDHRCTGLMESNSTAASDWLTVHLASLARQQALNHHLFLMNNIAPTASHGMAQCLSDASSLSRATMARLIASRVSHWPHHASQLQPDFWGRLDGIVSSEPAASVVVLTALGLGVAPLSDFEISLGNWLADVLDTNGMAARECFSPRCIKEASKASARHLVLCRVYLRHLETLTVDWLTENYSLKRSDDWLDCSNVKELCSLFNFGQKGLAKETEEVGKELANRWMALSSQSRQTQTVCCAVLKKIYNLDTQTMCCAALERSA